MPAILLRQLSARSLAHWIGLAIAAAPLAAGSQRVVCPFAEPRLDAWDPAEVAWAAVRFPADGAKDPNTAKALRAGLRRMAASDSPEHQRALLHLLQAAAANQVPVPANELRLPVEGRARIPWLQLQARAATAESACLFELFQRSDPQRDAAWEFLGGELAGRGHRTFALELRTLVSLQLRVYVGRTWPKPAAAAKRDEPPARLDGFPEPVVSYWDRDQRGLVGAQFAWLAQWNAAVHEAPLGEALANRARLRWLARLCGELDPVNWPRRFEVLCRDTQVHDLRGIVAAARQRANDALTASDAALRQRYRVPANLVFRPVELVVEDLRAPGVQLAKPLPAWK